MSNFTIELHGRGYQMEISSTPGEPIGTKENRVKLLGR